MATKTLQELKTANDLGNIQDGDMILAERVANSTGVVTFNGVIYDADFSVNGLMARTAVGTYTNRTVMGTSNRTAITNGDGVSGNPTVDISSSYVGQASITTLGTVSTGTWAATTIATNKGGTGLTSFTANGIVYASSSSVLAQITNVNNAILATNGAGAPELTTTMPTAVQLSVSNFNSGTGASSSSYLRGDGTWVTPSGSGAVASGTAGQLAYYATSGDGVSGLATVNNGVYSTNGSGVSQCSTTLPSGITATNMTLTAPSLGTPSSGTLTNCTGLPIAGTTGYGTGVATALAANVTGSGGIALATSPSFTTPILGTPTSGTLTNCTGLLSSAITTVTSGTVPAVTKIGEVITSGLVTGVAITSTITTNVTSIALTAGSWEVFGGAQVAAAASTTTLYMAAGISTTSATLPSAGDFTQLPSGAAGANTGAPCKPIILDISTTTTVYLVANVSYSVSSLTMSGSLFGVRKA